MKKDLTEIVMVIDCSGSMLLIKKDAEGGINSFIEEHRKDGDVIFTLCQFNGSYEFVYDGVPIQEVGPYTMHTEGLTALLDALGNSIDRTGNRLAIMSEEDRPGLVIFVIVTDGLENASKEYTLEQIKKKIDHQTSMYNWQFVYLGANQDAFAVAKGLGAQSAGEFSMGQMRDAYQATTRSTKRMKRASAGGQSIVNRFTKEELDKMSGT